MPQVQSHHGLRHHAEAATAEKKATRILFVVGSISGVRTAGWFALAASVVSAISMVAYADCALNTENDALIRDFDVFV